MLRFTNSRLLYDRLDEKLEWKHGKTFIPRGNKKLLCFVDDINLGQVRAACVWDTCICFVDDLNPELTRHVRYEYVCVTSKL